MPTNSYDVLVLGDDFAGLITATLCASRGLRVLLANTGHDTSYTLGPYRLPTAALPFVGYGSPAVRRVIQELHFEHSLKRKLGDSDAPFQFVGPNVRLNVAVDDQLLRKELEREIPGATAHAADAAHCAMELASFFDSVLAQDIAFPPAGFWERREVGRTAARVAEESQRLKDMLSKDPLIASFVGLPAALTANSAPLSPTPESQARCFSLWRQQSPRLVGDWEGLSTLFHQKFASHGGEQRNVRPAALTFSWGKVTGVRLDTGEELGADQVVAAMPVAELAVLTEAKQPKRLLQAAQRIRPAGYRYTLNLVVAEAGIPAGMGDTVLFVNDPNAPLTEDNAFAIYRGQADTEARVVVTLEATARAPERASELDGAFADLRVRLRRQLESVMPFCSDHVLLAHSPHERAPAEGSDGELALKQPVPPTPLWHSDLDSHLGVSALSYTVGVKHLTLASSQVLAGLGVEGSFAAGWCAAKIVCGNGRRKELSRPEIIARG